MIKRIRVRGHYRTIAGKTVYVKPHIRLRKASKIPYRPLKAGEPYKKKFSKRYRG